MKTFYSHSVPRHKRTGS